MHEERKHRLAKDFFSIRLKPCENWYVWYNADMLKELHPSRTDVSMYLRCRLRIEFDSSFNDWPVCLANASAVEQCP